MQCSICQRHAEKLTVATHSQPSVIVDCKGRGIVFLCGQPNEPTWPEIIQRVAQLFAEAGEECAQHHAEYDHRRGSFYCIDCGISFGQGQQVSDQHHNSDSSLSDIPTESGQFET